MTNPKDLRGLDPCELLTPEQFGELTITKAGVKDTSAWGEPTCLWQNETVSLGFSPDTERDGLEGTYRRRDNFENFAPSEVVGYPAVRVDFATNFCTLKVGVADDQVLTVDYGTVSPTAPGSDDPCAFAESVAATVLANLPEA